MRRENLFVPISAGKTNKQKKGNGNAVLGFSLIMLVLFSLSFIIAYNMFLINNANVATQANSDYETIQQENETLKAENASLQLQLDEYKGKEVIGNSSATTAPKATPTKALVATAPPKTPTKAPVATTAPSKVTSSPPVSTPNQNDAVNSSFKEKDL